jgi:general secretion pathway protein K
MTARRGFALMAAIWLLVAISGVAVELSVLARARRLASANSLEGIQAAAAAESGIEHARAILTRDIAEGGDGRRWGDLASTLDPWHGIASPADSIPLGNSLYHITMLDVGTRLNVDRATEDQLRQYLIAKGVDATTVETVAQSIMDWRDDDDLRRNHGFERADYIKAGARELPRNGPFESVEELRWVHGMTSPLFERIRGDLTVFGSGQIDVNAAPREVLMALPGVTALAADVIVRLQLAHRRIESFQQLTDQLPVAARTPLQRSLVDLLPRMTFDTHEMEVISDGWVIRSPVRVRERALIVRASDVAFVTWRRTD